MSTTPLALASSKVPLEQALDNYLQRLAQIDRILAAPVRTIFRHTCAAMLQPQSRLPQLPVWISEVEEGRRDDSSLTTALCLTTMGRVAGLRRRFKWLQGESRLLPGVTAEVARRYLPTTEGTDQEYFDRCVEILQSPTFGLLNPLSASQAFRLLMWMGEEHTHRGTGCIAFFSMLWSLNRGSEGASIGSGEPSAYVTAKCVLPLAVLNTTCKRRAMLYRSLSASLGHLAKYSSPRDRHEYWSFCTNLEQMRRAVAELADIAVGREALQRLDAVLGAEIETIALDADIPALFERVLAAVTDALKQVRVSAQGSHRDTTRIVDQITHRIIRPLGIAMKMGERSTPRSWLYRVLQEYDDRGLKLFRSVPGFWSPEHQDRLQDVWNAAEESAFTCRQIIDQFGTAATIDPGSTPESLCRSLETLALANDAVAGLVAQPISRHADWCSDIVNREIAYASADNLTDFDAAELVSALAVAMRMKLLETRLQVADGVAKALVGVQRDGSWRLGHPFFSPDGTLGMRPPTSDVVWTLTAAIKDHPEIRVADDDLFRFVDWLERTQRRVQRSQRITIPDPPVGEMQDSGLGAAVRQYLDGLEDPADVGWPVDRIRLPGSIHLATTAYSINALLSVRDMIEHRIWELCKERFTIRSEGLPLNLVDPVDLLAPHPSRLHSVLAEMARATRTGSSGATYSLVLHGPPGSSKTAVAEALAREMWRDTRRWGRSESRLIRVTPADFTRLGEDRMDAEAALIFQMLRHVRGVTILFDEVDDLLRRRTASAERPRFMDLVTPAMLNRLQDLRDICKYQEVCFLFGTNYVENIEPALMRAGRIDRKVPVVYPDWESRSAMAAKAMHRHNAPQGVPDRAWSRAIAVASEALADHTSGWPWSSLSRLADRWADWVWATVGSDSSGRRGRGSARTPGAADFAAWLEIVADSAEDRPDLRAEYEERLAKSQGHSSDLEVEYLHYLVSTQVTSLASMANAIESAMGVHSGLKKEDRERILDRIDRLPHARRAGPNGKRASPPRRQTTKRSR